MDTDFPLYLIPLLPLLGALLNLVLGKRLGKGFVSVMGCTVIACAMALSWLGAIRLWQNDGLTLHDQLFAGDWFHATEAIASHSIAIKAGLLLDRLSSTMTLVITTCGFFIHVYSTGYMIEDEGYHRYFAYLNLFTGAMLILVLGDSLPVTFVGWEGVGLCSYLLIGFWFTKEANAYAGRKAFVVNRIGDFGFLLGMFMIFAAASTLNYEDLAQPGAMHALGTPFHAGATYGTIAALLLFIGCCGKSAQLPLYVWLPDAMAGPTPVSALIHAATMVTAGVYLVARMHFLFEIDPFVLAVIACVGAATALYAATMGLVARPIKKILAYSTVSQLGFMFIGVGTKAFSAGIFHLVTHAFFKAGLFLGAGSIMHALAGEEDVFKMGGLRKKLPITHITFLIYCLAIAGVVPFAGFFSKDAILAGAWEFDYPSVATFPHWLGHVIYGVGIVAAACTAFYMFRCYFLVFHGAPRDQHLYEHAHESPREMTIPLIAMAVGSVALGFLGLPSEKYNLLREWLPAGLSSATSEPEGGTLWALMAVATVVSLAGIAVAWRLYGRGPSEATDRMANGAGGLYRLVLDKYRIDELYDFLIVKPLRKTAWFLWRVVDAFVIDLVLVRGSAAVVDRTGRILRYLQNGDAQRYVVGVIFGAGILLLVAARSAPRAASEFSVEVTDSDVLVRAHVNAQLAVLKPLEYIFDFGDGSEPLHQPSSVAHHHYAAAGKKQIKVSVVDGRWQTSATNSRTVEVK